MTGKPGRSGRQPAERTKSRQVGFRLDEVWGVLFDAAVAEAAREAPPGVNFTASDYLRGLFMRDAEARGLTQREGRTGRKGAKR